MQQPPYRDWDSELHEDLCSKVHTSRKVKVSRYKPEQALGDPDG
jgi:hypothetical protein